MIRAGKVKNWIIEDLQQGQYPSGSKLPTRHTYMDRYGISRSTIDKVMAQLVDEGMLYAVQGAGTFVAGSLPARRPRIVFIGEYTSGFPLWVTDSWSRLIKDLRNKADMDFVCAGEVEKRSAEILKGPSWVIWDKPRLSRYSTMEAFANARVHQLLINRHHPGYSFVTTDTRGGISLMLDYIARQHKRPTLGMFLPTFNPERPYHAEREMFFVEQAVERGWSINRIVRTAHASHDAVIEAAMAFFDSPSLPRYIFMPESDHTPHLLAVARSRGKLCGRDFNLLLTDGDENMEHSPGLIYSRQQWSSMMKEASDWARHFTRTPLQRFVMPTLHITKGTIS